EILTQQTQALDLTGDIVGGAEEEDLRLFVLPAGGESARTIAVFTAVVDAWRAGGTVKDVAPITVGAPERATVAGADPLVRRTVRMALRMRNENLADFSALLCLAGLLTVEDAITPDGRKELLAISETGNPEQITSLKRFLSTGLLPYLRDPLAAEERLLAAFPTDALTAFLRMFERTPLIRDGMAFARGPVGTVLLTEKLWPLPFLTVSSLDVEEEEEGWVRVEVELMLYGQTRNVP
ncbi:MAG: hypothetical protein AAB728_05115, partial [Patescibacteria group bacterium]